MKHYHGTPLGGTRESVARFAQATPRHFLIPWKRPEDLPVVAGLAAGFCIDNSAFTAWKQGEAIDDWRPFYRWVIAWSQHPGLDFVLIPDVIDGDEKANDDLIREWDSVMSRHSICGVPVWHMHESLGRLDRLVSGRWPIVALGSSGEWPTPGTDSWWERTGEVMAVACDANGQPRRKLHGLRMLSPQIVQRIPFASADSTNVAQNSQLLARFGQYKPPSQGQRREVIASRIEAMHSPAVWVPTEVQQVWF